MKNPFLTLFLTAGLIACESQYEKVEYVYPDGTKKFIEVTTVIDSDTLYLGHYKSGSIYLRVNRIRADGSRNEEVFYYYEDGGIMDYKYYIDEGLKFYARYDQNQKIIQLNGDPILWYEDPEKPTPIEQNAPRVFKTLTFKPPHMTLKSWLGGNELESPMQQIKTNPDSLAMDILEDDTLGYLFRVPDTTTMDVIVLWSLEDERTGEYLKAGKFSQKYKGVPAKE